MTQFNHIGSRTDRQGEGIFPLLLCHKTYEKLGVLSHAHNFGVDSPTHVLTGLALLCLSVEVEGLLYGVLQLVGVRDNSLALGPQSQLSHLSQALIGAVDDISPQPVSLCGR